MAKRNRAVEDAPRPLHTYIVLAVVVIAVVAGAYLNRDAITALVTDGSSSTVTASSSDSTSALLQEPACVSGCGRACWLYQDGQPESTFVGSSGKIGILACGGNCYSVADTLDNARCCVNADCPSDKQKCSDGICSS